jgi:hypothetical protein
MDLELKIFLMIFWMLILRIIIRIKLKKKQTKKVHVRLDKKVILIMKMLIKKEEVINLQVKVVTIRRNVVEIYQLKLL